MVFPMFCETLRDGLHAIAGFLASRTENNILRSTFCDNHRDLVRGTGVIDAVHDGVRNAGGNRAGI